jgi:hypothetical protein
LPSSKSALPPGITSSAFCTSCYPARVTTTRATITSLFLALTCTLSGCHKPVSSPTTANLSPSAAAEQRAERESQREQIALIPPPSKTRFMAVHTFDAWENPTLTVQTNMLTLHVLQADTNTSNFGAGGILRPTGARRQEITIAPEKLSEAMAAIPESAWPYGRVVAVEEAHKTPKSAEPAVRRTMESTVNTLSDLGISAYDLTEGKLQ